MNLHTNAVSGMDHRAPHSDSSTPTPMALIVDTRLNLSRDPWAVAYLTIQNLQPIMEELDDDGSGFITTEEVNMFYTECPEGWS